MYKENNTRNLRDIKTTVETESLPVSMKRLTMHRVPLLYWSGWAGTENLPLPLKP
jgi:hypothetical protein